MEKCWKKIYFSGNDFVVLMVRDLLKEKDILSVVMNRKDISYQAFGDVKLFMEEQEEKEAMLILDQLIKGTI